MKALLLLLALVSQESDPWLPLGEDYTWIYVGSDGKAATTRVAEKRGDGWTFDHFPVRLILTEKKREVRVREVLGKKADFVLLPADPKNGDAWSGKGGGIRFTFACGGVDDKGRLKIFWTAGRLKGVWWLERGRGIVREKRGDRLSELEAFRKGALHPIGKGYTWTYDTDYEIPMIYEVQRSEKVNGVETFVLNHHINNRSMQIEWLQRTPKGLVLQAHQRGKHPSDVAKPFVRIPVAPRKGDKWTGVIDPEIGGEQKFTYTCRGEEKVKVPAGTFQAIKIDMYMEGDEGHSASGAAWYAPGIGMVKYEMSVSLPTGGASFEYQLRKFEKK